MSRFYGIILSVIAITSSVYAAEGAEQGKTRTLCSVISPEYKSARDEFKKQYEFLVAQRFTVDVNTAVDVTSLNNSGINLVNVANKTCNNGTLKGIYNHSIFLNFMKFSLKNATILQDLHVKGAFKCILEQQHGIKHCINASNVHWESGNAMNKAHLNFNPDSTCLDTNQTMICTLELLNEKNCGSDAVSYVKSLFNYLLENYCKRDNNTKSSNGTNKSRAEIITGILTSFSMLAVVNGMEWLMV